MIPDAMEDALNAQLKVELDSAHVYLSMSAWFEDADLPGFASWMRAQAEEEREHAMKFYDFISDRGGRVRLTAIEAPQQDWESALAAVRDALAHEEFVTGKIHELYRLAESEGDLPTRTFLNWFVDEQVEEEKTLGDLVARLTLVDGSNTALLAMDRELAERGAAPPA